MPEPGTDGTSKERLPWERLPKESEKAYSYFALYRDLGRDRTVYAIADQVKRARGYLYQLSRDWQWVRRAEAWDREQDRVFAEKMADRRRRSAETNLTVVSAVRGKLVQRLQNLDVEKLTPADWIRWFEVIVKLEREIMGQPSVTVGHAGPDGGPIRSTIEGLNDEDRKAFLIRLVAEANSRAGLNEGSGDEEEPTAEPPMTEHGSNPPA